MGTKLESIYREIKADKRYHEQIKIWWNGLKTQNGARATSKKIRRSSVIRRVNDEVIG